jgi:chromatin segregation and condensation protein Rec8/ScpA/Scc1 (kleisin family)
VSLERKISDLKQTLQTRGRVSFRSFISASHTREEVVVAFLAVLELIKTLLARAEQDALFGDIQVVALQSEAAG